MFKYKTDLLLATKTIIAVIISIGLTFWWLNPMALFYVIYTAAAISLMQAGTGKKMQLFSMVFAACAYVVLYLLGVYLRADHFLASLLLIPFAFIAYYMPNLGLTYRLPPIMGVIIYLVVMMMPVNPIDPTGTALGMCVASAVAVLVYFFLWHYSIEDELLLLMLEITEQYRSGLQLIMLWRRSQRKDYLKKLDEGVNFCEKHIIDFEEIKAHPDLIKNKPQFFNATESALYAISKIVRMFVDVLPNLSAERVHEFYPILKDLIRTLKFQENKLSLNFERSFFTRRLIRKSLGLSKDMLNLLMRQEKTKKIIMDMDSFEQSLLKIVKPIQDKIEKNTEDLASLQFAFGLLRIKELYSFN